MQVLPSHEADDILWQNFGNPVPDKTFRGIFFSILIASQLLFCYFAQLAFKFIESKRIIFESTNCEGNLGFSDDDALEDFKKPLEY
jgi:hypothetical protein